MLEEEESEEEEDDRVSFSELLRGWCFRVDLLDLVACGCTVPHISWHRRRHEIPAKSYDRPETLFTPTSASSCEKDRSVPSRASSKKSSDTSQR